MICKLFVLFRDLDLYEWELLYINISVYYFQRQLPHRFNLSALVIIQRSSVRFSIAYQVR
jgi:hypothetical protein